MTNRFSSYDIPGFKLVSQIGEGGMSTVWKAFDIANNRWVALKILNPDLSTNGEDLSSFFSEESMMSEIEHPGIVKAYGLDQANGIWCLSMELVDGYTFADFLKRKMHVCEADCLLICESVAAALDYAWNDHGIVHCDIKPENIMINTDGIVKLTDLGISHRFNLAATGTVTVSEHVTGTPAYISPEQVYGDVELDCRADIYSLAATLYHLSTGRILFPALSTDDTMRAHCSECSQANDPRAYRPELSEGFSQLLEAMLVKNRDYRISSWSTVIQMCQDVERGVKFKPRSNGIPSSISLIGNL